jgi:hypothetical protein
VFVREKITLSIGHPIRFTKNVKHRGHKFLNNELRTVVGIDEGKIMFDKGEIVHNGAALHLDQGIAVTSHASQAKTVDQVIVRRSRTKRESPTAMQLDHDLRPEMKRLRNPSR